MSTGSAYRRVIERLDGVVETDPDRQASALCPAHDDTSPSLSVTRVPGRALVYCHSGCKVPAVLDALGLTGPELYDDNRGLTYRYPDGRQVIRRVNPDGTKKITQNGNTKGDALFLSHPAKPPQPGDRVYVVEGEQDVGTVRSLGAAAVSAPNGARHAAKADWSPLAGTDVVLVPDQDEQGLRTWLPAVLRSLDGVAASVTVRHPVEGANDVTDHVARGLGLDDLRERDDVNEDLTSDGSTRLPASFWEVRPSFAAVRQAAEVKLVSPEGVLAAVLARVSALLPPDCLFETGQGPVPLNTYACLFGDSSSGKSLAMEAAADLIIVPSALDRDAAPGLPAFHEGSPGSGEGLVETFIGEVVSEEEGRKRAVVRHNSLVTTDEGKIIGDHGRRSGTTYDAVLASAWKSARLGQDNADAKRRRNVPPHSYVLGFVMALQPAHAGDLFEKSGLGLPQRFLFARLRPEEMAEDPEDLDDLPGAPDSIEVATKALSELWNPDAFDVTSGFKIPDSSREKLPVEIRKELRQIRRRQAEEDPEWTDLNGHRGLVTVKVAGCLAILDGRTLASVEDWQLAQQIVAVSIAVRDDVLVEARLEESRKREQRRREQAETFADGDEEAESRRRDREAVRSRLLKVIGAEEAPSLKILSRAVAGRVKSRRPGIVRDVLDELVDAGSVVASEDDSRATTYTLSPEQNLHGPR